MKAILLHGKDTNPNEKWYPWFKDEMNKLGIEVSVPELPNSSDPDIEEWLEALAEVDQSPDTVLLGHSRGGVAIMRYLERLPAGKIYRKVILIAANSGFLENQAVCSESNKGFYTDKGYDFVKIKSHCLSFTVFHSRDDKWVPFAHGLENAKGLSAKMIEFTDKGILAKVMA